MQKILPDRIIESSKLYSKVSQAVAHTYLMTSLFGDFQTLRLATHIVECVPQPSTLPKRPRNPWTYVASLQPEQKNT